MEVGAVVNEQYTVVEHIGRGGMADVWSARDQRLRRMVAIKTIAVGLTQDVDPVALFRQEAETIASMEHPHILPIYDFGEYGGSLYIVMRFVTGGSLEDLLEQGPLSPNEALRIGEAIASALDYAHTNKIIHLDLKPPNILMDSGGSPYLADFGLATVLDPEGRARNPGSGTLLYMAPEQLTAEVIDHRADIYSFSIMMYHMLTGKLPFDGTMPLALRQLQFNDELPALEESISNLPVGLTEVLRRGTAKDPRSRPTTLMNVIEEMRAILQPANLRTGEVGLLDEGELAIVDAVNLQTERLISLGDPDLLEAVDIYTRARYNWAGGQGRFLVSLTHFLIMSNYYQDAHRYDLPVDEYGLQMLLRGALEYDVELDYWWAANSDENRRWVCLHTLRSGTTPARIRAMYRLETLPDDSQSPMIPKLVAQALEVERDPDARLAALRVLAGRAKLLKSSSSYQIKTEFVGRLVTTMTRLGIEIAPATVWREAVYSPEIDLMIAEQALDTETPAVAEYAARTVGRIYSLTGVRHLANEQRARRPGALQALALVRDEAPSLPDVVSPQARAYAWITNTVRRLTDRPLQLIMRFALALLGGWIAFGEHIYSTYYATALFTPQRWGNTIAAGLTMGVFIGVVVLVTDELSTRLKGFWTWWMRMTVASSIGIAMGILTWAGIRWFYFGKPPALDLMRLGGMGLALGFVFVSVVDWKRWKALWLPALLIYLPIVLAWPNECLQDYYCTTQSGDLWLPAFNYFPVAGVGLAIGLLIGWFIPRKASNQALIPLPDAAKLVLAALAGIAWIAVIWHGYLTIYAQDYITYDHISLWYYGSMFFALIAAFLMKRMQTVAFGATALIGFSLLAILATQAIFAVYEANGLNYADPANYVAPQKELGINGDRDALLTYLYPSQLLTVGIPMVFVIALGAYVQSTFASISAFIGMPKAFHRGRDAWLTGTLIYTLIMSGIISVLSLFSIHVSVPYGLGWSLWGFLTFVCALAVWRWARWGAVGLLALGVALIGGAALYDALHVQSYALDGLTAPLLEQPGVVLWGIWSVFTTIFAAAALRRHLWGGIGLVLIVTAWYVVTILGLLPSFATIQAVANLALVVYALQPFMAEMEKGRLQVLRRAAPQKPAIPRPAPVPAPASPPAPTPGAAPAVPAYSMHTELDASASLPVPTPSLRTEIDVQPPRIAFDPTAMNSEIPAVKRPLDPTPIFRSDVLRVPGGMETQIDPLSAHKPAEPPKIKIDLSALTPSAATETQIDPLSAHKPAEPPKIKIDLSALTPNAAPETQIDAASLVRSQTTPQPEAEAATGDEEGQPPAESRRPSALKIDTSTLNADKPPTEPHRPRLKFDISSLNQQSTGTTRMPPLDEPDEAQE
jgi:serine/threonine protein kinase